MLNFTEEMLKMTKTIIDTPELKNDGIAYIARNRQNEKELAIYTVNGDVYVSDAGPIAWRKF
ncbi:hypothetical protein AAT16_00030 [Salinicoccus halodurans]|uniref:Uncharacterized protein n=2 Tax=Salinicoccus halodurans TaxID=407035 RepID=A0ABM5T5E4_9STAP|nr:hypothetical protein AAT16_00030 [Salinicoccus halodurans]